MSRIGNEPVIVPQGVEVKIDGQKVSVIGPKGNLSMEIHKLIKLEQVDGKLIVKRKNETKDSKSLHGLSRSLLNNMVLGVSEGFTRDLAMVGVGYRASGGGDSMTLSVGFSHPVVVSAPEGISFTVSDNTKISVSGIDKILVGQTAANIRKIKPPEVYKGKGIRFVGEYIRRKPGKAGKGAGAK